MVDYGIFTILAAPLFWLLKWLYGIVHNWGLGDRSADDHHQVGLHPLNHASAVDGEDESHRAENEGAQDFSTEATSSNSDEDDGDVQDREDQSARRLSADRRSDPVFIALYWVLLSGSGIAACTPWILWIHDLSAPDPYFVPVIYAITAYLQVRLSPTPFRIRAGEGHADHADRFSVMFIFFPSGLVLYWLVNNSLQIFQQWH